MAARQRARSSARGAALALPHRGEGFARALPSRASLLAGVALFACATAAFVGARETSVFAVGSVTVRGAPAGVERDVSKALRPLVGISLLKIDAGAIERQLDGVAWVSSMTYDRSFPHTLVVTVRPERPVAVLRGGAHAWLLSARGRVLQPLPLRARPALPRVWVGAKVSPTTGMMLGDTKGGRAARALAPLPWLRFPAHVTAVAVGHDELTFVLATGIQLRLGNADELKLKLAIARRVLRALGPAGPGAYVDVSVPERPVASTNPQAEG